MNPVPFIVSRLARLSVISCLMSAKMAYSSYNFDVEKGCRRLEHVPGNPGCVNDVLVNGSVKSAKQHVIFFGGDVQDYKQRMLAHNEQYSKWSLEYSSQLLSKRFPSSVVFVVKPAEMFLHSFSIYSNFLKFNSDGCPEFSKTFGGLQHLQNLYKNAVIKCLEEETKGDLSELDSEVQHDIEEEAVRIYENKNIPVIIVGFSKGCVVVNQLMYESQTFIANSDTKEFLSKISAVYWLDGGHTGGEKAWITDDDTLEHIKNMNWKLYVHVTPYQISDPMRKWIGKEEETFVSKMKELQADIEEHVHFKSENRSIRNHFMVLEMF